MSKWKIIGYVFLLAFFLYITGCSFSEVNEVPALEPKETAPTEVQQEIVVKESTSEKRIYNISNKGKLELMVPKTWKESIESPAPDLPPTISLYSEKENDFLILITVIWNKDGSIPSPNKIKTITSDAMNQAAASAIEPPVLAEINENNVQLFYFSAIDKNYNPNNSEEYPYVTQGSAIVGKFILGFTILYRDENKEVAQQGLNMIASAVSQN